MLSISDKHSFSQQQKKSLLFGAVLKSVCLEKVKECSVAWVRVRVCWVRVR